MGRWLPVGAVGRVGDRPPGRGSAAGRGRIDRGASGCRFRPRRGRRPAGRRAAALETARGSGETGGDLSSFFHLKEVEILHGPRGGVELLVRRGEIERWMAIPAYEWRLSVRPALAGAAGVARERGSGCSKRKTWSARWRAGLPAQPKRPRGATTCRRRGCSSGPGKPWPTESGGPRPLRRSGAVSTRWPPWTPGDSSPSSGTCRANSCVWTSGRKRPWRPTGKRWPRGRTTAGNWAAPTAPPAWATAPGNWSAGPKPSSAMKTRWRSDGKWRPIPWWCRARC